MYVNTRTFKDQLLVKANSNDPRLVIAAEIMDRPSSAKLEDRFQLTQYLMGAASFVEAYCNGETPTIFEMNVDGWIIGWAIGFDHTQPLATVMLEDDGQTAKSMSDAQNLAVAATARIEELAPEHIQRVPFTESSVEDEIAEFFTSLEEEGDDK